MLRAKPFLVPAALLVALLGACGPDQGPPYGGANALQGVSAPLPTPKTVSCGTVVSDMNCSVKFNADILPVLKTNCADVCHGAKNAPPPVLGDPLTAYANMDAQRLKNNTQDDKARRYINPCSKDSSASYMLCNLEKDGPDATCGSHMPVGSTLPAETLAKVKTWLDCGAPNN